MDKMLLKKQYMMYAPKKSSSRLPSGYQEVEYIQGTGTQYIDMGIVDNENYSFVGDAQLVNPSQTDNILFGNRIGSSRFWIDFDLTSSPDFFDMFYAKGGYYLVKSIAPPSTRCYFEADFKTNRVKVNDFGYFTLSPSGYTKNNINLYLFKANWNNVSGLEFKGRLYYFKVYDNGVEIRNFIPCYRKSDGEVGMFDLVSNTFFTNQGSGTFLKGADV